MYIPAADMSLANPKSPTLATKLASTKIFLAAKSRWTNCEKRQCIIFSLETLNDEVAHKKARKIHKPIYKLGLPTLYIFCLTEAHE